MERADGFFSHVKYFLYLIDIGVIHITEIIVLWPHNDSRGQVNALPAAGQKPRQRAVRLFLPGSANVAHGSMLYHMKCFAQIGEPLEEGEL